MKSWEVLRDAIEPVGVKAVAARLKLSTALVYKWCQEPPGEELAASGARNPLDRLETLWDATRNPDLINWICHVANGFFMQNPVVEPPERQEALLANTQKLVESFGVLLADISRGIEDDGQISDPEAQRIRETWERLKSSTERFVVACERGLYRAP